VAEWIRMKAYVGLALLLVVALSVNVNFPSITPAFASPSDSIELEEFRWNSFPIRVLVDMNEWSKPDYAVAVREALDAWIESIWTYTDSFGETSLRAVEFDFRLSNVNSTGRSDVYVTFASGRVSPSSDAVGLTTYSWNRLTHEPLVPITINLTTYSKTVSSLFVKNVAMHEVGHALGLGHASSSYTSNGPELMYARGADDMIKYPSTLDAYGLAMLYQGNFSQVVHLPSTMPYEMLIDGYIPAPLWMTVFRYVAVLAVVLVVVALILWKTGRRTKPSETESQNPVISIR